MSAFEIKLRAPSGDFRFRAFEAIQKFGAARPPAIVLLLFVFLPLELYLPCVLRPAAQYLQQQRREAMRHNTILHQMGQHRYKSAGRPFWKASRLLFKEYPYSVSAAVFFILMGAGSLLYTNYYYHSYIIGAFLKYPEPVAKQLRKALYYTNMSLEPRNAMKYYREALRVADEMNVDSFSDEIMGIKFHIVALLERVQHYQKAIDVLEIVKADNLKWIEILGNKEGNQGKRNRILGKTVSISVKLGELYANQYVLEREKAEEQLVWAVETLLKEQQRREREGVKEGEGEWLSAEEIGGTFESLGHHYEEMNHHYLAAPLFLQALMRSPPRSCHTAVLMNNLSISLAQQLPPSTPDSIPITRTQLISNARAWAEKAIALTSKITPPERTEECDVGCAVATHNLGEFAEMDGNVEEARRRFEEAKVLARAVGFREGVANAEKGLKRIKKKA
ncbi:putative TPR domain-containing protein [Drepanopeziza brunnea f. sp. 'multigermtubi' MB_m1]|uniref:Putative TPR domain-containing protein n=1 Tax=Marssonina brunnea f. sp. multigermtubi (strain MB_m1) TaxID=1072389 RepID=K1WTB4_MARBU|nr:putative TPR domain-containing protein [Drepanopeziza brunnea f. sp. 'multigermtubi' MB_m1]EKD20905.1 putative TPR domain-containing protein [Drepanopeziza brunnea f. sp. 'multigermtubi' MB_m1]